MLVGYLHQNPHLHGAGMVTSYGGFSYNLLEFTKEMVSKTFIAEALSKIHRYNGQYNTNQGYSVAQHSVMMAESILLFTGDPVKARCALWHDGSEAYTGDVVRPLKHLIKELFGEIEEKIEATISEVLGIPYPYPEEVKMVDINICNYEITFLLNPDSDLQQMTIWGVNESRVAMLAMDERLLRLIDIQKEMKK